MYIYIHIYNIFTLLKQKVLILSKQESQSVLFRRFPIKNFIKMDMFWQNALIFTKLHFSVENCSIDCFSTSSNIYEQLSFDFENIQASSLKFENYFKSLTFSFSQTFDKLHFVKKI